MLKEEDIESAYRLILGREPESLEVVRNWSRDCSSVEELGLRLLHSRECADRLRREGIRINIASAGDGSSESAFSGYDRGDLEIFNEFPRYEGPGKPGFVTDFLGTRTDVRFISRLRDAGGVVEGLPVPANFHADTVEWLGVLKAVLSARERMVSVELGAGWGPWLAVSWEAARSRGITDVRLVGVEADEGHLEYLKSHLKENGIDPSKHTLLRGVVAERDGTAKFPFVEDPSHDWGAAAVFGGWMGKKKARIDYRGFRMRRMLQVPAYSLQTILKPFDTVDLVHCDVQGAEYQVFSSARKLLNESVRWVVIGTHSRLIEGQLVELFMDSGWQLAHEKPCRFQQLDRIPEIVVDGCQVWKNPSL